MSIKTKLYDTLRKLGISNPADWDNYINILLRKLTLLNGLRRYDGLLKNIFSSNERNEFNSYAFEVAFAYDFEVNDHQLEYEVNILSENLTSIDYCYETNGRKMYFELRVINQRDELIKKEEAQLKHCDFSALKQDGNQETIRLQNSILSKCQNKKGSPIKFGHKKGSYNFIVVFVSALYLRTINRYNCLLTTYGDEIMEPPFRSSVFGLCQKLPEHATEIERKYYEKFNHFRETIHGVLFVKNASRRGDPNYLVDLKLQYFLVCNNTILGKEEAEEVDAIIEKELSSFLPIWGDSE